MPTDVQTRNIFELIDPIVTEESCDLRDVELVVEHGQRTLRVTIGKDGGVGIADCDRVSRAIEDIIEVEGGLHGRYNLEVSSPGETRPLTKPSHFREALGALVRVQTVEKIDGRQNYKGVLKNADETQISLEIDGQEFCLPLAVIRKAGTIARE